MTSIHPTELSTDDLRFLEEKGYRYISTLKEDSFVGLFSVEHDPNDPFLTQVVIKKEIGLDHEYELGIRLIELAPTAPISRPLAFFSGLSHEGFLVLEAVPGIPLQELSSLKSRDHVMVRRFLGILHQIIDLLASTGLYHGDLHLGNILTNDNLESFTLIDFGLSEIYDQPDKRTYPICRDIEMAITKFYGGFRHLPIEIREKIFIQEKRDLYLEEGKATTFSLFEDITWSRSLIELVRSDLLG